MRPSCCICVGNDDDVRSVVYRRTGALAGIESRRGVWSITRPHPRNSRANSPRRWTAGAGLPRCAGVRRASGRTTRSANDHGGGRRDDVRSRRSGSLKTYARAIRLMGPCWQRSTHEDGQSDLHRRRTAGSRGGSALRRTRRTRRRRGGRRHFERRRAVVADGESFTDDGAPRIRVRLRGRLDAQGPRDGARGRTPVRRAIAADGARRSVLCRRAGVRRRSRWTRRA